MSDPHVRRVGEVFDVDERPVIVGVDYDTVSIGAGGAEVHLEAAACEELAQLFVSACWQAAAYAGDARGRLEAEAAAGGTS
jgi:hypothetical protein